MHHWLHKIDLNAFVRSGADILVVAYLIYRVIMLAKGTRAWQIISGILVFSFILWFSAWAQLSALNWLIKQMFLLGPVALVILFLPELRHALEEVGRFGFWGKNFVGLDKEDLTQTMGEIVRAAEALSARKIGALIVLERATGLTDYIETGTLVNALVSEELLGTLFYPGSPLHDGAIIVRRDRVVAAGCTLPLTENRDLEVKVHTRHKAALGISEQSDAVVLVVSEETGIISVVVEGRMQRHLRDDKLREYLVETFLGRERTRSRLRRRTRPAGRAVSDVPASVASRPDNRVDPKPAPDSRSVPDEPRRETRTVP